MEAWLPGGRCGWPPSFACLKIRSTRQAAFTSGGEQQRCAIGVCVDGACAHRAARRAVDGLVPPVVDEVFGIGRNLNRKEGVTFLLAEETTHLALRWLLLRV